MMKIVLNIPYRIKHIVLDGVKYKVSYYGDIFQKGYRIWLILYTVDPIKGLMDLPIRSHIFIDEDMSQKTWLTHRENGPAILHTLDGFKTSYIYCWYKYGFLHKEDGPASVYKLICGGKFSQLAYYIKGNLHREDGPAMTSWYGNNIKLRELWYINGKKHREDSLPAVVIYNSAKSKELHEYWIDGLRIFDYDTIKKYYEELVQQ